MFNGKEGVDEVREAALARQREILAPTVAKVATLGNALDDLAETRRFIATGVPSERAQPTLFEE